MWTEQCVCSVCTEQCVLNEQLMCLCGGRVWCVCGLNSVWIIVQCVCVRCVWIIV